MNTKGIVHKYGDNIDTDIIIPARYLNTSDPKELAAHCMEPIDPDFPNRCKKGDILVAGSNFGSGSSREHAPIVLKECGISCVIAKSYARIFYRNSINTGLVILECAEASEGIENGDSVSVDYNTGVITNHTRNETYKAQPFPAFIQTIFKHNGLLSAMAKGEIV